MPLKFPGRWRFEPPTSANENTNRVPSSAVQDFMALVRKTATQGDLQGFLEHYKGFFCAANGTTHYPSSNVSWAETDLDSQMNAAAANPPLFIEAFFDASEAIRRRPGDLFAPDAEMINRICRTHNLPYEVQGVTLVLYDPSAVVVAVPQAPPSLAERAQEILQTSLRRAEDLLMERRGREAVQETLWLLETVAGHDTGTGTVEGKYFNDIAKELRHLHSGTTLERVLKWAAETHGYLSSPTGGGVRHGLDLTDGVGLSLNEARLFCNLVRSYLSFLLSEYERLSADGRTRS
jgi:hypothetical protein